MYVKIFQSKWFRTGSKPAQVQFGHKKKWGPKNTRSMLLGDIDCSRVNHTCSSAKVCEYIHPEIRNMKVTHVNADTWTKMKGYGVEDWDINSKKRDALR